MKSVHQQDNDDCQLLKIVRRKIIKNCAERMAAEKQQEQDNVEAGLLSAEEKELCGIV